MNSRIYAILTVISMLLLVGCASSHKMAFQDDTIKIEDIKNPVFLMTATIKNEYKTSHQPKMLSVNVVKTGVNGSSENINFRSDDKSKNESDDSNIGSKYLIRMELESGEYVLRGFTSMSSSFPIHGFFFTPLHETLKASEPGIYYLGSVNATVRKREGDEFKAGSSIPLLDQAIAGASGGTFEIKIADQWSTDGPEFKKAFPILKIADIKKQILPEFNRERAQKWWEDN